MNGRIGYASKTLGLPDARMKALTLKTFSKERFVNTVESNLSSLEAVLDYCNKNNIRLFRISSDIIPFGSSPVNEIDWPLLFKKRLANIGSRAKEYNIKLSMHPGQYTVLNSPNLDVANRAVEDLRYHALFLDALGMGGDAKIILHVGGLYGDKQAAIKRFLERYSSLEKGIKKRLVIENDDKLFTAQDVLAISSACGAPVVFDVLHHRLKKEDSGISELECIDRAKKTWKPEDGRQKIHYSQQACGKRAGSHSATIGLDEFLSFVKSLENRQLDIMLEVKDKNISAIKCINALDTSATVTQLEQEWARYKYVVLEHDQAAYQQIRQLLKDKNEFPVLMFYRVIEAALLRPATIGTAQNAIHHVWGYVSPFATKRESSSFETLMERFRNNLTGIDSVKKRLHVLAEKYGQEYLLKSYFFDL